MIETKLNSVEETQEFGAKLARLIPLGTVIALMGNLGAGKTTLSQGFAKGLLIDEHVGSPTFKLVGEYDGAPHKLYHIDCYRIEKPIDFWWKSSGESIDLIHKID